jgi:hypothetical protein
MDIEKYIGYYKNVVPEDVCDGIMTNNWELKKSDYAKHTGGYSGSNERVKMDETYVDATMPFWEDLKTGLSIVIKHYSDKHKKFTCHHHTHFRINKYSTGGFMSEHSDNIHHSHGQQYGYPLVSVIFYLNNDYEGGEFFVAEKEFVTEKGSAIIFPSNFMFPHKVKEITKGTRWSIISWVM